MPLQAKIEWSSSSLSHCSVQAPQRLPKSRIGQERGGRVLSNPALRTSEIFPARMPELARRRNPEAPDERWHVYRDPVPVPRMRKIPGAGACGFYPASHPAECTAGTAATFDQAHADFEDAWRVFLSNRIAA